MFCKMEGPNASVLASQLKQCLWPGPQSQSFPPGWLVVGSSSLLVMPHGLTEGANCVELCLPEQTPTKCAARLFFPGSSHLCPSNAPVTMLDVIRDSVLAVGILKKHFKLPVGVLEAGEMGLLVAYYTNSVWKPPKDCARLSRHRLFDLVPKSLQDQRLSMMDNSALFELEVAPEIVKFEFAPLPVGWHRVPLADRNAVFVVAALQRENLVLFFHGNGESLTNHLFDGALKSEFEKLGWGICFAEVWV